MNANSSEASSHLSSKRLAIFGVGNMGGAIARGLIAAGAIAPSNLLLSDNDPNQIVIQRGKIGAAAETMPLQGLPFQADIVLVAVKPAALEDLLRTISPTLTPQSILISIVAGKSIKTIEDAVPVGVRVIRAMPNTPALVLEGASAIAKGTNATDADIDIAREIFGAVGKVVEVNELLLDAVTGLSGSGPAYIFTVIEALTDGGVLQGLSRDTARMLAAQTVFGAAKMVLESTEHIAKLKDQVTTPGGTTIHGLAKLEEHGVRSAFIEAVAAATDRSSKMG
jgi:pyrroline-5-carboxylate reductase